MIRSEKHFISKQFLAPNVVEADVEPALLSRCAKLVPQLQQITSTEGPVTIGGELNLYVTTPKKWSSDIRWISQDDMESFAFFEELFHAIAPYRHVERYIDYEHEIILYSGFFVTRKTCLEAHYHMDWDGAENDAFTFLTPISNDCGALGLVYRNLRGGTSEYTYRHGKALIFGDHFNHSTAPGEADETEVLLCFNFGTDRMDNWDKIAATTAHQGNLHRRPDGTLIRGGKVWDPLEATG